MTMSTLKRCPCGSFNVNVIKDYSPEYGWLAFAKCSDCAREINHEHEASAAHETARLHAVVAWNTSQLTE
jgi:hypothetical protein